MVGLQISWQKNKPQLEPNSARKIDVKNTYTEVLRDEFAGFEQKFFVSWPPLNAVKGRPV